MRMALPARRFQRRLPARWDPFIDLEDVYERMGRLLEGTPFGEWGSMGAGTPADLEETDDAFIVTADLPGVKRDDISVDLTDRGVTISGEIKEPERTGVVHRQARRTGRFDYRLTLPGEVDADKVEAKLENGVLTVRLPKAPQAQARKIPITGG